MSAVATLKFKAGDRIGRWTVLGEYELTGRNERKWLCRCDCGTERYVLERSLLYGGSESCGCLRKERALEINSPDLTGQQFGELKVIQKVENTKHNSTQWLCKCSCGADYVVQGSLLVTGRRTRCPSKVHEKNYAYVDITGQRFERLVAQYPSKRYDKSGSVIWHCKCDCGNEIDVPYNSLVYCNQKSCGCQKKEHDQKLQTFLTHVAGTSVDMLKSKKIPTDNTTGYKGVYLIRGKYVAKIVFQKKQYFLGTYDNIEDAAEARKEAEEVLFDGVAEHYQKWKEYADADPDWAEQNPIQIIVNQQDRKLNVALLPDLQEYSEKKERIENAVSQTK